MNTEIKTIFQLHPDTMYEILSDCPGFLKLIENGNHIGYIGASKLDNNKWFAVYFPAIANTDEGNYEIFTDIFDYEAEKMKAKDGKASLYYDGKYYQAYFSTLPVNVNFGADFIITFRE